MFELLTDFTYEPSVGKYAMTYGKPASELASPTVIPTRIKIDFAGKQRGIAAKLLAKVFGGEYDQAADKSGASSNTWVASFDSGYTMEFMRLIRMAGYLTMNGGANTKDLGSPDIGNSQMRFSTSFQSYCQSTP